MKVGIVVPHMFMHRDILPSVIFSPGALALDLAKGLQPEGVEVTLFTPGPVETKAANVTADLRLFEQELAGRNDSYIDLLKKHPFTFITLARQVQSELIAQAFAAANRGELDLVHIYTNEEDIALPFAQFCSRPVVFTHHDPFNFLVKYKSVFPKYPQLNWLSLSDAQRIGMPENTNWLATIYHGVAADIFKPNYSSTGDYVAFIGRIIEPKGVHLAIEAVKQHNHNHPKQPLKLKIAGKHYAGHQKDAYWQDKIEPQLDGDAVEYVGFIKDSSVKGDFLAKAKALLVPSIFEEPFGMVAIEALACGTPVIGLDSGALPELIDEGKTGTITQKVYAQQVLDEAATAHNLALALESVEAFDRRACREAFEQRFTTERMCQEHLAVYKKLITE